MDEAGRFRADMSERIRYNIDRLPVFCRMTDDYPRDNHVRSYPCHWHTDIQLYYVQEGVMDYYVNGSIVRVSQGEGLFINSRRLHYAIFPATGTANTIIVNIHPNLLMDTSEAARQYAVQRFSSEAEDCLLLSADVEWERTVLDSVTRLYEAVSAPEPAIMDVLREAIKILTALCSKLSPAEESDAVSALHREYLRMTDYISVQYRDKLTVDDIARAGMVSRSKCNQLFHRFARQSPNVYLNKFRLSKSVKLLGDTDLNITEISAACGFQSASYYNRLFKLEFGETPQRYRERIAGLFSKP